MSIGGIVTQGFLVSPSEIVTLGYSSGTPPLNVGLLTASRKLGAPGIVQRGGPGFGGKVAREIVLLCALYKWNSPIGAAT